TRSTTDEAFAQGGIDRQLLPRFGLPSRRSFDDRFVFGTDDRGQAEEIWRQLRELWRCLQALIGVRADGDDGDDARALVSALARKHMPEQVKKLSGFLLALLSEKLFPLIDRN